MSTNNNNFDNRIILQSSPLFSLSMASKELFHTNFLYWISKNNPNLFISILNSLDIRRDDWPNRWNSYQDNNHYDLSIKDHNNDVILILENKVKSIPIKEQLDRYEEKNSKNEKLLKILLSLSDEFPQKDEIKKQWKIISYKDLSDAILLNINKVNDTYHKMLLTDYCLLTKALHNIQGKWSFCYDGSYIHQFVNKIEDDNFLRLSDIRSKILYSRLTSDLQQKLGCPIMTNKEIKNLYKSGKNDINNTYINWGMTRSQGLIDIKTRICGNLLLVIQIQGNAYKHCIEALDKSEQNLSIIKAICSQIEKKEGTELRNFKYVKEIIESEFIQISNRSYDGFPLTEEFAEIPNSKDYNHYGNGFIYQYLKIKPNTSVRTLFEAIIRDYNNIISLIENINQSV